MKSKNRPILSLDELGLKFRTDKASSGHDYLKFYERYFLPLRMKTIKLLEIGVLGGASLSVWEEYFPFARIIGADIVTETGRFARGRVAIEIINQASLEDLVRLGLKHGPFDVIIEDGSHMWEHQKTTLQVLFPFLNGGGFYIVEDLQTNFGSMAAEFRGVASISCVEYLKKLVDFRVGDDQVDISLEEDSFLRTYGRSIQQIAFYRRACLLEKSAKINGLEVGKPFVSVEQNSQLVGLYLSAHIGGEGDRQSPSGFFQSATQGHNIQGFELLPPEGLGDTLIYRARLADGDWTEWGRQSEYVGTKLKDQDITGFEVSFSDLRNAQWDVKAIGLFAGESEPVIVGAAVSCTSSAGLKPLVGMQVVMQKKSAGQQ